MEQTIRISKTRIALFALIVFALFFSACRTTHVLGVQRQTAAELLRKGDLDFIIRAELLEDFSGSVSRLHELTLIHSAAPFYASLLAGAHRESHANGRNLELLLLCATLKSPSLPARREATIRLLPLILETGETQDVLDILGFLASEGMTGRTDVDVLRAACLFRLRRYDEALRFFPAIPDGGWEKALALFSTWNVFGSTVSEESSPDEIDAVKHLRQKTAAFLFDLPAGRLRQWAYAQALSMFGLLGFGEYGVIASRRFPAGSRITLENLRPALLDGGLLFFRYPALMADLARVYQLIPALREEALNLFAAWDSLLETFSMPASFVATNGESGNFDELESFVKSLDSDGINVRRFLILQHAGRIKRAAGRLAESSEYFRRTLNFASNTQQSDSSFWYILMNTLVHDPPGAAAVFLETIPQWGNMPSFNAVIDRLSAYLTAERKWDTILEIFSALESRAADTSHASRAAASLAQYAWIVGRAVQEGFIETERSAESFFRIAFEHPNGTVYYRTMAAMQLGENFSPTGNAPVPRRRPSQIPVPEGSELEFILGFFEFGATSFVLPYIRTGEGKLSIPELRMVAEALAAAGNWPESIRVVFRYRQRHDYEVGREGFYLSHPRPYTELIERHARENGFRPELLFGLIRTESLFSASVVSHAGAVGLAQLMPTTAPDVAARIVRAGGPDFRRPEGIALTDPDVNVHLG